MNEQCTRCGAKLNPKKSVWLELDSRTNLYHEDGKLPPGGLSQGGFPFGTDCAKVQLEETARAALGEGGK